MPIKWSPGCGCCGTTCEEKTIAFTATTEQDRNPLPAWMPFTEYLQGDGFHQASNFDGAVYLYEAPRTLFSGSGWTLFEETRYVQIRRVDLLNEVTEWDLFGSGWGSLSETELDDFLRNGKLAEGMGYLSKAEVLPSVESWRVDFSYSLVNSPFKTTTLAVAAFQGATTIEVSDPQVFIYPFPTPILIGTTPNVATGINGSSVSIEKPVADFFVQQGTTVTLEAGGRNTLRLQTLAQVELDQSGELDNYYLAEAEWLDRTEDPPGYDASDRPRLESRQKVSRVVDKVPVPLDTLYTRGLVPTTMRRGIDVFGAFLLFPSYGSDGTWDTLHLIFDNEGTTDLNKAVMIGADGTVVLPGGDIEVETGDVLILRNTPSTEPDNWELVPAVDVSLVDILESGYGSIEVPDPDSELQGRRVAIYIAKGQEPSYGVPQYLSPDVSQFTGVFVSRTRTPSQFECAPVQTIGSCNQDDEFDVPEPYFVQGVSAIYEVLDAAGDEWLDIGTPYGAVTLGEVIYDPRFKVNVRGSSLLQFSTTESVAKVWTYQLGAYQRQRIVVASQTVTLVANHINGFHTYVQAYGAITAVSRIVWIQNKPFFDPGEVIAAPIDLATIPTLSFSQWELYNGQYLHAPTLAVGTAVPENNKDWDCLNYEMSGSWNDPFVWDTRISPKPNFPTDPLTWTIKNA